MAMAKQKNRGGRPRKSPIHAGEKSTLSVRISPEVRKQLERAIAKNGRSLTQEAEFRIEQSLYSDRLLMQLREDFLNFLSISSSNHPPELRRQLIQQYLDDISATRIKP
jgi:hypothetical protein